MITLTLKQLSNLREILYTLQGNIPGDYETDHELLAEALAILDAAESASEYAVESQSSDYGENQDGSLG